MGVDKGCQLPNIAEDTASSADGAVNLLLRRRSKASHQSLLRLAAGHLWNVVLGCCGVG